MTFWFSRPTVSMPPLGHPPTFIPAVLCLRLLDNVRRVQFLADVTVRVLLTRVVVRLAVRRCNKEGQVTTAPPLQVTT